MEIIIPKYGRPFPLFSTNPYPLIADVHEAVICGTYKDLCVTLPGWVQEHFKLRDGDYFDCYVTGDKIILWKDIEGK